MHGKSEGASAAAFDRTGVHSLLESPSLLSPTLAPFASGNAMFGLPLRIWPGLWLHWDYFIQSFVLITPNWPTPNLTPLSFKLTSKFTWGSASVRGLFTCWPRFLMCLFVVWWWKQAHDIWAHSSATHECHLFSLLLRSYGVTAQHSQDHNLPNNWVSFCFQEFLPPPEVWGLTIQLVSGLTQDLTHCLSWKLPTLIRGEKNRTLNLRKNNNILLIATAKLFLSCK